MLFPARFQPSHRKLVMERPDERREAGLSSTAQTYRNAKPYLDAAWLLTGSVIVGTAGGYLLDRWLHTKPWLLLVGILVGLGSGFTAFVRVILRLGNR
jgi:F0F1-type ATP synthase assembly protein I